ncbi:TSUP family transporter [Alteromonas sp. 345S023]|uniref:Probable membrane transporter protein n=1 Tax=Alteromonas profundi TaxID=2696062 RepID=A0A7X5LIC8_9ALTE|nr:sulfite exporter TauE/SafE family protein [Alteromonas profundi]NDV89900.1 TSUP family transporter [Alteromonas profundi]
MFTMLIIAALLVGLSLGLMGAGGSILAVPLLMLLLNMSEKVAIKHALLIVGLIALVGVVNGARAKLLKLNTLVWFALASIPSASVGAYVGYTLVPGLQTLLLIIMMLISAIKMLKHGAITPHEQQNKRRIFLAGAVAGFATGIVGIGGGFLIVPALVLFAGLSMQQAVANSLLLIFINALVAYATLGAVAQSVEMNYLVIVVMTATGMLAVVGGQHIAAKIPQKNLKKVFAYCLIGVAALLALNTF